MKELNKISNSFNINNILDLLLLVFLFISTILAAVLFLINKSSASGQQNIIYIVIALVSFILIIKYRKRYLPSVALRLLFLAIIIFFSFLFTQVYYGINTGKFISCFKSYCAMSGCISLLACLFYWYWYKTREIDLNIIFILDILLTFISFIILIKGGGLSEGNFIRDNSGFVYQSLSYCGSYCLGFTVFLAIEYKRKKQLNFNKKVIFLFLGFIELFTAIFAGGRGGFVLSLIIIAYATVFLFGIKKIYKILIIGIIFIIILNTIISYYGIDTKGLERVFSIFAKGAKDTGRLVLIENGLEMFKKNPIFGNGIGSVYYYSPDHPHNLFICILAETGIIGLILFLALLIEFIYKSIKLYSKGSLYRFLVLVFIYGFTMNLFSGYFWINQHIWLPIVFILFNYSKEKSVSTKKERV